MSNIVPFDFEGHQLRTLQDEHGDPWFVASDLSALLGYAQTNSMNKLIDDEDRKNVALQIGGNYANQTLINESGMYAAIFGSTKEEAKRFKRWVTSEVLPSIRKNGDYLANGSAKPIAPVLIEAVQGGIFSKATADFMLKAWLCTQHPGLHEAMDMIRRRNVADATASPVQASLLLSATEKRSKPIQRKTVPKPIQIHRIPPLGLGGCNFVIEEIADYVVGGLKELKRAMRDFGLVSEAGIPTANGKGLVTRNSPNGYHWKVQSLLKLLSTATKTKGDAA